MDEQLQYGKDYKFIPITSLFSGNWQEVASDIYALTVQVVNLCFVGDENNWVLIDAGMPRSHQTILNAVKERFGTKPKAIILTHGHFDHVGGIVELVKEWDVPVYAHPLEIPYLTGEKSYPKPDATVEGGLVARMSPFFPNEPIQLGNYVKSLPMDGSVPTLKDWRWIHTPGHTPGHISLFRESDQALIAGDAVITVKQDSLFKVLVQEKELNGPPRYFTTDWKAAYKSIQKLQKLQPNVLVTGHGLPMKGEELKNSLKELVSTFHKTAIPKYGKYVEEHENNQN